MKMLVEKSSSRRKKAAVAQAAALPGSLNHSLSQSRIDRSPLIGAQSAQIESAFGRPLQCHTAEYERKADISSTAMDSLTHSRLAPSPNRTGLPDQLKAGVENLSGLSLDDVRVHYNSPRPARVQALAFTQGAEIHVAPGQERHLPHEAWHVTQQKRGRVRPTAQVGDAAINDETNLETEADVMGTKALQRTASRKQPPIAPPISISGVPALQRKVTWAQSSVKNMDLVDTVMTGADFGFTAILVNGHDSDQANPLPLKGPEFDVDRSATGQIELTVASEAENNLGTRMQLPTAPPWERLVDKSRVGGRLIGDARDLGVGDDVTNNYALAVGQTLLKVKGDPSDGALARLTKTHEEVHVADNKAAKEAIVDPWDAGITAKMSTGAVTVGADPEAALQQFYHDVGGSPADIGRAYMAECARLGTAFHRTGPGSKPKATSIRTTPTQSAIEVFWKHPVEEGLLSKLFG